MMQTRRGFVLGKPIRDPHDFHGREHELRELFESVLNLQPVAIVGEHRCGNTSILYQMLNDEVRARYVPADEQARLLFVYANAQLATDGPDSLYRRLARALRRYDPDAQSDFDAPIDQFWLEDYLEELGARGRRLVLLLDEFDVLASFESNFWEWFRGLITEYDLSIVVATRVELGAFRDEWGSGSPFFNMFRTIYIGSFTASELDAFLESNSDDDVNLLVVKDAIGDLAGRFPYYVQVAAALFYELGTRTELTGSAEQVSEVTAEYRQHTRLHFEDIWARLPDAEREAMTLLSVGADPAERQTMAFAQALLMLERRGYVVDGRLFSTAFADFIGRRIQRIELSVETGEVSIERRPVELPPKEFALLRFLLDNEGEVVTKDEIANAVWPEYHNDTLGVTDAMIQKTISRLRKEVDVADSDFQHIESVRGQGYRFQNANMYDVRQHNPRGSSAAPEVAIEA